MGSSGAYILAQQQKGIEGIVERLPFSSFKQSEATSNLGRKARPWIVF